jgi:spoIIIJ-associated protein
MNESLEEAIVYAKNYLEDLLSFFGIGQRGENMRSLQYLTSTALKNNDYAHSRVNVDIAEYKKQRADRLRDKAETWVKDVRDSGKPMDLEPMNAADRRVVHQLAAEYGLTSESAGEGRERHIVLKKEPETA